MARILITSWGSYGDVYPYVGLALALRELGHRPVIATAEFYRAFIESLRFAFHPAGPMIDPDDRELIARVLDPVRGSDVLLKGILMPAVRGDYAALDRAARPGEHPLFEGQFSPMLTLALFSRVLAEPQPDWPRNVRVTGFVFYNGPDVLAPELEAFLDAGPPPVVFTLGTSAVAAAGRFYEESVGAVRRLGHVARTVLPRQYRGARVAKELERLLSDTSIAARAAGVAERVVSEGGAAVAAAAIQHACATFVRGNANDSRHVSQ